MGFFPQEINKNCHTDTCGKLTNPSNGRGDLIWYTQVSVFPIPSLHAMAMVLSKSTHTISSKTKVSCV